MNDGMLAGVHIGTYWAAVGLTFAALATNVRKGWRSWSTGVTIASLAILSVSIGARWIASGHAPIFGAFENTLASAWAALALAAVLPSASRSTPRTAPVLLTGWAALVLAAGSLAPRTIYPLTISERSLWIDLHALLAWVAFTLLVLASLVSIAVLAKVEKGSGSTERWVFTLVGMGFAFLTAMMAVGSYYSYLLFADWYRWEIVGVLTMSTWLAYGSVVHARLFFGWRGRRLYLISALVLPLLIGMFWIWSVYPATYHFFDIPELRAF